MARRAYLFTLIAGAVVDGESKDYARATRLLNDVERLASKLDSTRERIAVLLAETEVYSRFDVARASEILRTAYKTLRRSLDERAAEPRLIQLRKLRNPRPGMFPFLL
jgi:hypothetical protein